MSPHHSMASSSGKCFVPSWVSSLSQLFPSANTLRCRQSINASDAPKSPSQRSIKIKFSNQFPIVIRHSTPFRALSGASQKILDPVDRRPIIVYVIVWAISVRGTIFRRSELKGKSSRKYELPWLVSPFFPLSLSLISTPQFSIMPPTRSHRIYFIMNVPLPFRYTSFSSIVVSFLW